MCGPTTYSKQHLKLWEAAMLKKIQGATAIVVTKSSVNYNAKSQTRDLNSVKRKRTDASIKVIRHINV